MAKTEICSTLEEAREKWPEYNGAIGNRFKNISGQHINNLTILYRGPNLEDAKKRPRYVCKCDCGAYCCIKSENITSITRPTRTCGHCDSFKLSQKKEINGFNILNTFINEKDNNKECCTLQCQKCGYIFYPRKTDLYDNAARKIYCAKCNSLKTTNNFNIGDKVGELTLLSFKVNEDNCIRWECECSCGKKLYLKSTELNNRRTCGNHFNPKDIEGKVFNNFTVLKALNFHKGGNRYYSCKCNCGNIFETGRNNILSGHTKSCGCLNKLHLENQKFGFLNVIKEVDSDGKGSQWLCKCDCGNITIVRGVNLTRGSVKSCGCIGSSFNNKKIQKLLFSMNIKFNTEYKFNNCRNILPLPFDFAIIIDNNIKYLIEYDGEQHFFGGWGKDSIDIHERDLIKNKYCFDNNIPLIRIPYDANYTIDDLKLETTRFLLTPENEKEYYESRK